MHPVVAVFSGKSKEHILADGGTQSWRLVPRNAAKFEFVVCCRSGVDWAEGPEERGTAFLVGRISGIEKATDPKAPERYLIRISEYADIDVRGAWKGWRNPVKYTSLEELEISFASLKFQPMPERAATEKPGPRPDPGVAPTPVGISVSQPKSSVEGLSISQAKSALASYYGVAPESIEITIRG